MSLTHLDQVNSNLSASTLDKVAEAAASIRSAANALTEAPGLSRLQFELQSMANDLDRVLADVEGGAAA